MSSTPHQSIPRRLKWIEDDCNDVMDMAEKTVKEQYNDGVATDLCGSLICEKYSIC